MPIVSVVIPLYNKEKYITRSISSVLTQQVEELELIVVNDGSTDNGKKIIEGIQDRRLKIIDQDNQGVSAARNLGIEASCSDLIAFLDADDEWKPGFLKTILSLKNKYPDAGAYGTSYEIMLRKRRIYHPKFASIQYGWEGILPSYFRASFDLHVLNSSAVAIPVQVFQRIGGFPIGEKLGEDLDMWLRIGLHFPIAFSNIELAVYHQDATHRTDCLPVSVQRLPYLKRAEMELQSGNVAKHLRDDLFEYVAARKIGYAKRIILRGGNKTGRILLSEIKTNEFENKRRLWRFLSYFPQILFDGLRKGNCYFNSLVRLWLKFKYMNTTSD